MTILFCYTAILVIACVAAFLACSVLWQWAVAIFSFEPEDEDDEEDDTAAWDRGHDQWVDRAVGL